MLPSLQPPSLQPLRPPSLSPAVRFSGMVPMGRATQSVDRVFGWLGKSRTREMLVEDFVGFGFLRTGMDLFRNAIFGTTGLNFVAARERLFREGASIFTDNIVSGLAAYGIGAVADRKLGAFSNGFTDYPTMELFRDAAQNSPGEQAFIKALAARIRPGDAQLQGQLRQGLTELWRNPAMAASEKGQLAERLGKSLKQEGFDLTIGKEAFKLDALLDDLSLFSKQMRKLGQQESGNLAGTAGQKWQAVANGTLKNTLRIKNWKLACVGIGLASTFAVPFINRWMTRRIDGIETYPGELGLRQNKPVAPAALRPAFKGGAQSAVSRPGFAQFQAARAIASQSPTPAANPFAQACPYVNQSWQDGNKWPLLLAMLPLPFAAGLFDTVSRRFVNPFKKGFGKYLRNSFDFAKGAPFTTQPQMASMFALLITARLLCSRSGNEFRERLVDSGMGWVLWILGTPLIKKGIASVLDRRTGSQLLKSVNGKQVLRSRGEIQRFLTGAVRETTLKKSIWLGAGATVASMILLGIVEPLIGILWTKRNAERAA